jgi:hypothetical protein
MVFKHQYILFSGLSSKAKTLHRFALILPEIQAFEFWDRSAIVRNINRHGKLSRKVCVNAPLPLSSFSFRLRFPFSQETYTIAFPQIQIPESIPKDHSNWDHTDLILNMMTIILTNVRETSRHDSSDSSEHRSPAARHSTRCSRIYRISISLEDCRIPGSGVHAIS